MSEENILNDATTLVFTVGLTLPYFVEFPDEIRVDVYNAIEAAFGECGLDVILDDVFDVTRAREIRNLKIFM